MFELKVLKPLTDKYDPEKKYKEGDTLLTDEIGRVNNLVARGICSIVSVKPTEKKQSGTEGSAKIELFEKEFDLEVVKSALNFIGAGVAKNAGLPGVTKKLSELTEEQNKAISEILCKDPE